MAEENKKEAVKEPESRPEVKPEVKLEEKPEAKLVVKRELADFKVGDTIKVYVKIQEAENKFRLQPFEGIVIRRRGSANSKTFTVRKISYGEGVERIFPLNSPSIDRIEVVRKGKVKKSKLYYLRSQKGKASKVEEETT